MDLLIYLPACKEAVPLLLTAGFAANNSAVDDPGVKSGGGRIRDQATVPQRSHRGSAAQRDCLSTGFSMRP
jgi:hypothetical protein